MMKKLAILMTFCLPLGLMAQEIGDQVQIDGNVFQYQASGWVQQAVGNQFEITKANVAVYKDLKWQLWHREGDLAMKQILDLGPRVRFVVEDASGELRSYAVIPENTPAETQKHDTQVERQASSLEIVGASALKVGEIVTKRGGLNDDISSAVIP